MSTLQTAIKEFATSARLGFYKKAQFSDERQAAISACVSAVRRHSSPPSPLSPRYYPHQSAHERRNIALISGVAGRQQIAYRKLLPNFRPHNKAFLYFCPAQPFPRAGRSSDLVDVQHQK